MAPGARSQSGHMHQPQPSVLGHALMMATKMGESEEEDAVHRLLHHMTNSYLADYRKFEADEIDDGELQMRLLARERCGKDRLAGFRQALHGQLDNAGVNRCNHRTAFPVVAQSQRADLSCTGPHSLFLLRRHN